MFLLGKWHLTRIHECGILCSFQWNGCAHSITAFIIKRWILLMVHSACSLSDVYGMPGKIPSPIFHFCTPFRLIKLLFYSHLFLPQFIWFHHSHQSALMRSGSKCLVHTAQLQIVVLTVSLSIRSNSIGRNALQVTGVT